MGIHKWRRRQSENFGEVWVPYAQIELFSGSKDVHPLLLQIDSGAIISILRRSIADLLGIDVHQGRHLVLTSVGGATTVAYVHLIQTKFAENIAFPVPFAIAEKELVPNLLGRLGVFDQLQIDFDATQQRTHIHSPWTDPDGLRIWQFLNDTEAHILSRFPTLDASDGCKSVIRGFVQRAAQIVSSGFAMTQKHTCYAGPILLRSLFELSLQFEYLLQDREVRSNQYAEFAHIKKHEIMQAIVHNPGGFISQQLACSPLREEGEARNKAEYDRVRPRFLNKKGGTWSKWYGNSAFWLAEILEREAEYRLIYAQTSAWSHGDPCLIMAAQIDAFGRPEIFWMILVGYYSRILCALAESFKIVLSHEQFEVLKNLAKDKS